jgi:hypothetical protein
VGLPLLCETMGPSANTLSLPPDDMILPLPHPSLPTHSLILRRRVLTTHLRTHSSSLRPLPPSLKFAPCKVPWQQPLVVVGDDGVGE